MIKKIFICFFSFLSISAFGEIGFSFGASSLSACNIGTACEEPEINSAVSAMEDLNCDVRNNPVFGLGALVFLRYNFPKLSFLGIQADFSFISHNGFVYSIDTGDLTMRYEYTYKSLELAPLVTYDVNFGKVYFTFVTGPNFSIPLEGVTYSYKVYGEEKTDFNLDTKFVPGLTGGMTVGTFIDNIEIFFLTRYTFDFKPEEYLIAGKSVNLLTRRCLTAGFGVRYVLGSKK